MEARHVNRMMRMAVLACVMIASLGVPVHAQTRRDISISQVGVLHQPGDRSPTRTFQNYSYGLGSLQGSSPGSGGDVLRSTIAGQGTFLISRPGGAPTGLSAGALTDLPRSPGVARRYTDEFRISDMGGLHKGTGGDTSAFSSARAYLDAIGASSALSVTSAQPITSLAPNDASRYSDCMKQGERYFRAREYQRAYNEFQLASLIDDRDPSSLLSMCHAMFAMSRYSYASSAHYLRQAMKFFPELPTVPLQPRGFYGQPADYAERMAILEDHLRKMPSDAEGYLLLAYHRWFDGDVEAACEAVSKAYSAGNAGMKEDIEKYLWKGMLATGKVFGTPKQPTTRPVAPTTTSAPTSTQPTQPASQPGT